MEIRRAKRTDLCKMNDLLYQVAGVHHVGRPDLFKAGAKKYSDEELLRLIEDDNRPIFVGLMDGEIVCHLYCVIEEAKNNRVLRDIKTLYIDDLCVDESCRGQKVGQKMYAFIKEWARERGFYNITLNVWSCNPTALKFYEKMGLVPQKIGMEEIL